MRVDLGLKFDTVWSVICTLAGSLLRSVSKFSEVRLFHKGRLWGLFGGGDPKQV